VGDEAEIGGGIGLIGFDPSGRELLLQRLRKGRPRHQGALDRRDVPPGRRRSVEQNLEEVRRAAISHRAIGLDQLELLLRIARPGGNDGAAERPRAGIHDEAARGQVIAEGVEDDVAPAEAGGKKAAGRPPRIGLRRFGLEDGAGRGEETPEGACGFRDEAAEGQGGFLKGGKFRLAQHGQRCKRLAAGDAVQVDALESLRIGGSTHGAPEDIGKAAENVRLSLGRIAGFEQIKSVGQNVSLPVF
jgi:hypothetical protein